MLMKMRNKGSDIRSEESMAVKNPFPSKKIPRDTGSLIRKLIAFIAVVNLILLFGFNYNIPGMSKITGLFHKGSTQSESSAGNSTLTQEQTVKIGFTPVVLDYDGTGTLDLLKGVTVKDSLGNSLSTDNLYAKITGSADSNKKTITYTYSDSVGNSGKTTRELLLKNYGNPSISVSSGMPSLTDAAMEDPVKYLLESGAISAKDGYGKDISNSITGTLSYLKNGTSFELSLTSTDMYGETAAKKVKVYAHLGKPYIQLKSQVTTLSQGDSFNPSAYIDFAIDKDGKDASADVGVIGSVNTEKPGTYTVAYQLTDANNASAVERMLTVTVAAK